MRKIFLILILIFTFSEFAYADNAVTVSLETVTAEIGQEVEIDVSISENSQMSGGNFVIAYDDKSLKLVSVVQTDLLNGYSCIINTEYEKNKIKVSWAGTTALVDGGNIFVLKFEALSESAGVENILFEKLKIADDEGNKINAVSNNGIINISSSNSNISSGGSIITSTTVTHNAMDKSENKNPINDTVCVTFKDVRENDWFYESVRYVYENNLMKGISETEFAPHSDVTRAMFVTVLYRLEKEPEINKSISYVDVGMDVYYGNAVSWAKQNSIVNGVSETEFAPNDNITREQIAAIIHRYAQYKDYNVTVGENTNILSYRDFDSISDYAINSMQYAVSSGLLKGKTSSTLNPKDFATRAEITTVLQRFIENNQ